MSQPVPKLSFSSRMFNICENGFPSTMTVNSIISYSDLTDDERSFLPYVLNFFNQYRLYEHFRNQEHKHPIILNDNVKQNFKLRLSWILTYDDHVEYRFDCSVNSSNYINLFNAVIKPHRCSSSVIKFTAKNAYRWVEIVKCSFPI